MKKVFRVNNLECAHCAAKMEVGISKLSGVKECSMNFIMQKLTVEFDDGADVNAIIKEAKSICKKIEPDCEIVG